MADDFASSVSAWVAKTKARTEAVFKESAQRVLEVAQTPVGQGGNIPVDTGFMRASLMATLGDPGFSVTFNPQNGQTYQYDGGQIALTINNAKLGDTISAVYTASYAIHVHYGTSKMPPRPWVTLAAQQWQRIVSEVCAEAQSG